MSTDASLLAATTVDAEAFGEFYDRHSNDVLRYFVIRTACTHTASDLTAETFAEALRTVGRFDVERGEPRAWLFGIAANMLRRYVRTSVTSDRALRRVGISPDEWDHADEVAVALDMASMRSSVEAGLDELSPRVRDAVRLRVLERLSYGDVAVQLGCSEGAARVRVTRGLSALADREDLATAWERVQLSPEEAR